MRINRLAVALWGAIAGMLPGCDSPETAGPTSEVGRVNSAQLAAEIRRLGDARLVSTGRALFEANCAKCHGEHAEGSPGWTRRRADGSFPPPPLNGSGHAWHHPLPQLRAVIGEGRPGSNMPGWSDKLTDQEIDAVIAYFHSLWPDRAREAWYRMNLRGGR
jgi:mono/diheme cytochrome c family protein